MQDLPKPVWELLAQKINDPKTWMSFSQVSRLTRFLTQKYKRVKQQEFSKFGVEQTNRCMRNYCKMMLPDGNRCPETDYLSIHFEDFGDYLCESYAFYTKYINGLKYTMYINDSNIWGFPFISSYDELMAYIKDRTCYQSIIIDYGDFKITIWDSLKEFYIDIESSAMSIKVPIKKSFQKEK